MQAASARRHHHVTLAALSAWLFSPSYLGTAFGFESLLGRALASCKADALMESDRDAIRVGCPVIVGIPVIVDIRDVGSVARVR